jgi:4-alpha-glucanotransferase
VTSIKDEIRKEAARILESATYASETQFEYAKRWRRVDRWIGSAAAALAAVAGIGGLSQVLSARWAGLVAVVAAGTGAVAASIGAPQTKEKAAGSATAYRALQQDARIFLSIDLPSLPDDEAKAQLQQLVERLQQLNRATEVPSAAAWRRAKRSIERGAQRYKSDEDEDKRDG